MTDDTIYVVDTNVLLTEPEFLETRKTIILPIVLRELEDIERRKSDKSLQYALRRAKRAIKENTETVTVLHEDYDDTLETDFKGYDGNYADNIIIKHALHLQKTTDKRIVIRSNDILLTVKARTYGLEAWEEHEQALDRIVTPGIKETYYSSSDEASVEMLENIQLLLDKPDYKYNPFGMKENEYLIIWNKDEPTYKTVEGEEVPTGSYEPIATLKYNGKNLEKVDYQVLYSRYAQETKPLNIKQKLAVDLLKDEKTRIKLISGLAGSGKLFAPLSREG